MESSNRSKTTGLKRDLAHLATLIVHVEIQCVACTIAANQLASRGRRFGNWPVNDSAGDASKFDPGVNDRGDR